MKRQKSLFTLLSLFVVLILALAACRRQPTPEPTEVPPPAADAMLESILGEIDAIREELPGPEKNCTVAADGQTYSASGATYSASGAGDALLHVYDEELSHGDLVFQKFVQLLDRLRDGILNGAIPWPPEEGAPGVAILVVDDFSRGIPEVLSWDIDDVEWLRLIAVDTDRFNMETGIIADRINEAIAYERLERFVINMSFAIVPCQPLSEDEYIAMVENDPVLSDLEEILQNLLDEGASPDDRQELRNEAARFLHERALLLSSYNEANQSFHEKRLENDPLIELLVGRSEYSELEVISVAATGNAGLPYPFAPAMWRQVLSVSAVADYANAGEVVAEVEGNSVVMLTPQSAQIHGTSFAAPELSVRAAYYLMQGHGADCDGLRPPLAYMAWDNLPLRDAAHTYCNGFPVDWPP
jgi:hypothetical protein